MESVVRDGDAAAMEGFTRLIPHAAGHEIIRQRRKRLTLIRMTPDLIYAPSARELEVLRVLHARTASRL